MLTSDSTGIVRRIEAGFRLSLSQRHSIDLVTGAIQTAKPDSKHGAVVLPANTSFDDACINDAKSALGSFFQNHFASRINKVQTLIQAEAKKSAIGTGKGRNKYPTGTTIYMNQPLKTKHRIIITAVTEKIEGTGIRADTLSLSTSIKNVLLIAADNRLSELWMPVIGTGHGGLNFTVALTMILVQLSQGMLREGFYSIERVIIPVHNPEGKRAEQIERMAKAFPSFALVGSGL